MSAITFDSSPLAIRHAIAASFDLSGFSSFCRRPDAHAYLTRFLAALFKDFDNTFEDGFRDFFRNTSGLIQVRRPDFAKYTGDGALFLWVEDAGEDFTPEFCTSVVRALRHFQSQVTINADKWEKEWRTTGLPRAARIGIASGPVQPLAAPNIDIVPTPIDYAGYCINLAVRLQDHCPEVGFIVHKPVEPQIEGLILMEALGMKGTLDEPVYLFTDDFKRLKSREPEKTTIKFRSPSHLS